MLNGIVSLLKVHLSAPDAVIDVLDITGVILQSMATVTEIGSLISRRPEIRGGRPCIAGTGVSVRRIAQWHNMGLIPEEIARVPGIFQLAQGSCGSGLLPR